MRLGIGEYSPAGFDSARFEATQEFVSALLRVVPNIGDDLTSALEDLPYAERNDARVFATIVSWAQENGLPTDLAIGGVGGFETFYSSPLTNSRSPLRNWGGAIADEWFSARGGESTEQQPPPDRPQESTTPRNLCHSGRFSFEHPGGELAYGTLAQLEDAVREAFELAFCRWSESIRTGAVKKGWPSSPSKRMSAHFEWLAQFQVLRRTYSAIARDAEVFEQTVAEGVRTAARLAGLSLRTGGRPGRPRKLAATEK